MQKKNLGDQLYVSKNLESIGRDVVFESRKQPINLVTLVEKYVRYLSAICAEIDIHFGAEDNPKKFNPEEVEVLPVVLRLFSQKMRTHVNFLKKISEIILEEKKKLSQSNFKKISNYFFKKIPSKINAFFFGDDGVTKVNYSTIGDDLSNYWSKRFVDSRIADCVISAEELERRHKKAEEMMIAELASNNRKNWYIWAATVTGPIASSLISGPAGVDIWNILTTNVIKCGVDTATTAVANAALVTTDDYITGEMSIKNSSEALLRGAQYGLCAGLMVETLHDVEYAFMWLMRDLSQPALLTSDHGGKHTVNNNIVSDQNLTAELPVSSVIATDLSLYEDKKILMVINAMYAVNISNPAEENNSILLEAELMQQFEQRVQELERDNQLSTVDRVLSHLNNTIFAYKQSTLIESQTTLRIE